MNTSETTTEIYKALFKFQGLVGSIKKDANNPFHKSKYATLDNIISEIHGPLQECKLFFVQAPGECLTTRLIHSESGEWIEETTTPIVGVDSDPQKFGKATTYAKRYVLSSMLGLSFDDDDDGNMGRGQKPQPQAQTTQKPPLKEGQMKSMRKAIAEGKINDVRAAMGKYAIKKEWEDELQTLLKNHGTG